MIKGFYLIDPAYIDLCRASDLIAISPEITQLYYGPISYSDKDWYVPYVPCAGSSRFGLELSDFHPDRAIPVHQHYVHPADIRLKISEKDFDLLSKQVLSIIANLNVHAQKCTAEFGIYDIQPEYLSLMSVDGLKPIAYCGPVVRKNNVNWFVPVTASEESVKEIEPRYENGVISDIIHLNRMIPCSDEVLSHYEKTTIETQFCHINKALIHDMATTAFNILSDQSYIRKATR